MKLVEISGGFQASGGAPCPLMIANDSHLHLVFYGEIKDVIPLESQLFPNEPIIELIFENYSYCSLSPPNDEALDGHPYFELGLYPYTFYELLSSETINKLSAYSKSHSYHNPNAYNAAHHYVLAFKEQLFECIADSFQVFKNKGNVYEHGLSALERIYKQ